MTCGRAAHAALHLPGRAVPGDAAPTRARSPRKDRDVARFPVPDFPETMRERWRSRECLTVLALRLASGAVPHDRAAGARRTWLSPHDREAVSPRTAE